MAVSNNLRKLPPWDKLSSVQPQVEDKCTGHRPQGPRGVGTSPAPGWVRAEKRWIPDGCPSRAVEAASPPASRCFQT